MVPNRFSVLLICRMSYIGKGGGRITRLLRGLGTRGGLKKMRLQSEPPSWNKKTSGSELRCLEWEKNWQDWSEFYTTHHDWCSTLSALTRTSKCFVLPHAPLSSHKYFASWKIHTLPQFIHNRGIRKTGFGVVTSAVLPYAHRKKLFWTNIWHSTQSVVSQAVVLIFPYVERLGICWQRSYWPFWWRTIL